MSKTVINVEETIGKTVGRRRPPEDALRAGFALQANANEWMRRFGHKLAPKGVYRFRTFEEADAWSLKHLSPNKTA